MGKLISGKRTYKLPVTAAGLLLPKEFELQTDIQFVTGVAVTADRRDLVWRRGTLGLVIAGQELIVDGEDAAEYIFGSNHPSRTWAFGELNVDSSDRRMRLRYQDNEVAGAAFSPYTVKIVVTYAKRSI